MGDASDRAALRRCRCHCRARQRLLPHRSDQTGMRGRSEELQQQDQVARVCAGLRWVSWTSGPAARLGSAQLSSARLGRTATRRMTLLLAIGRRRWLQLARRAAALHLHLRCVQVGVSRGRRRRRHLARPWAAANNTRLRANSRHEQGAAKLVFTNGKECKNLYDCWNETREERLKTRRPGHKILSRRPRIALLSALVVLWLESSPLCMRPVGSGCVWPLALAC